MGILDQFQRPTGQLGRCVAALMNKDHYKLTTWGLKHVIIKSNDVILDVGCGGGKTIERLARQVPQGKVFGIDYSPDMVAYAKEVNKEFIAQNHIEIHEASVDKTGLPSNFFDLVIACETYYFWPNLTDAFKELSRVLKSEGQLLMINEMIKDGVYDLKDAVMIEKTHLQLYYLDEIRDLLQSVGFIEVEIFRKKGSPWNAIVAKNLA